MQKVLNLIWTIIWIIGLVPLILLCLPLVPVVIVRCHGIAANSMHFSMSIREIIEVSEQGTILTRYAAWLLKFYISWSVFCTDIPEDEFLNQVVSI